MSIIDHIGLTVSDYEQALAFYKAALAPLGITVIMEVSAEETGGEPSTGLGRDGQPSFWISDGGQTLPRLHLAFTADSRAAVDAFYQAALKAGGRDNGAPGLRAHYHPDYYGAFVIDPEGHNLEAVCHTPA